MIIIVSLATDDLSSVVNWFIQTWKGGQEKENYPASLLLNEQLQTVKIKFEQL